MRGGTIVIPAFRRNEVERSCKGSAGPRANITGMRLKYWGRDALIYKIGQYIYYMGKDVPDGTGK